MCLLWSYVCYVVFFVLDTFYYNFLYQTIYGTRPKATFFKSFISHIAILSYGRLQILPLIICYRLLDSKITADYCILISLFHWEYLVRLLLQYNFLFCFTLFNLFNFRINILFNEIDLVVNFYFIILYYFFSLEI